MNVIPAILAKTSTDFTAKLQIVDTLPGVDSVHIDFADKHFVPSQTIMPAALSPLPLKYIFTAHLMCIEPAKYLADLQRAGFEIAAFHFEAMHGFAQVREFISAAKDKGLKPQMVINPATSIEAIKPVLPEIDRIQIMTVEPGFYGSTYIDGTQKIKTLRGLGFYGTIEVDGGIDETKIEFLFAAGADNVIIGSQIFKSKDPKKSYAQLCKHSQNQSLK